MGSYISYLSSFTKEYNLEEKGAYIFGPNLDSLHRCIYLKLPPEELREALPISYQDDPELNYLLAIFDPNGRDFLAQVSWQDVKIAIREHKMSNLLQEDFQDLAYKHGIDRITYLNSYQFAKEQLDI
tara:strand:- start:38 stop:418 length:381 start_codon:yes stop_codon:yes gene_type:complete